MRIKFNIPKLHSHIFRHTHVSLLSEAGIYLEIIQNRLGIKIIIHHKKSIFTLQKNQK